MQYRALGKSDIQVSSVCLGTMTWGEQNTEAEAHRQLDIARDFGINFIDTAEMYPVPPQGKTQGLTEQYIGSWLSKKAVRKDVILATKVTGPGDWMTHIRNGPELTQSHIRQALEASLQRLQTDYIDLYQIHWPSRPTNFFGRLGYDGSVDLQEGTPIRETLQALQPYLKDGRIRHYGISNETPWGAMSYVQVADELNMPRPVSIQNPYNLLNRVYEIGMAEISLRESMGLLAYSPLAFGVLSGKYLGGKRPAGARLTLYERFKRYTSVDAERATGRYVDLAQSEGISPVELALGFVTQQPFVTSNIIGATTEKQLIENIEAAQYVLNSEVLNGVEAIHSQISNPCP